MLAVNGKVVYEGGKASGYRPGRVLRRGDGATRANSGGS